jgi:hypothetical protein
MATVSFKNAAPATAAATTQPNTDVQVIEAEIVPAAEIIPAGDKHPAPASKAPAVVANSGSGITGEITMRDIQLPRVNLVQKIGDLADSGLTPGVYMLNKEALLSDGKTPLNITVLRLVKQYKERKEAGDTSIPNVLNTQQEVIAAGGTTNWALREEMPLYMEIAHLSLAIEKPEGLKEEHAPFFYRQHNGKSYTLAVYTVASSAFSELGKKVITAGFHQLSHGLWNGKWQLKSALKKGPKGTWFVPDAKFDGMHSPEDAKFFESMVSATA